MFFYFHFFQILSLFRRSPLSSYCQMSRPCYQTRACSFLMRSIANYSVWYNTAKTGEYTFSSSSSFFAFMGLVPFSRYGCIHPWLSVDGHLLCEAPPTCTKHRRWQIRGSPYHWR